MRLLFPNSLSVIGRLSLSIVVAVMAETAVSSEMNDSIVAKVDGLTVTTEEYRLIMNRQIAGVYSHFAEQGMEDSAGFWKRNGGICPINLLRLRTLEELRRIKCLQAFAREKGLLVASGFDECRAAWRSENERRAAAIAADKPVYGPRQYSFEIFYFICQDDLIYRLKEVLTKEVESTISEAAVLDHWEKNKELLKGKSLEEVRPRIITLLQQGNVDRMMQERIDAASVEANEVAIAWIVPRND